MLTAQEIMTPDVYTIYPEATIQQAIDLLLDKRISGLPVIDRDESVVGILTEYGLLAMAYDKQVRKDMVAEHMTTDVISVDASTPVSQLADLFIIHRVRRLPIIKNDKLVGLISRIDVLRALCETGAACSV